MKSPARRASRALLSMKSPSISVPPRGYGIDNVACKDGRQRVGRDGAEACGGVGGAAAVGGRGDGVVVEVPLGRTVVPERVDGICAFHDGRPEEALVTPAIRDQVRANAFATRALAPDGNFGWVPSKGGDVLLKPTQGHVLVLIAQDAQAGVEEVRPVHEAVQLQAVVNVHPDEGLARCDGLLHDEGHVVLRIAVRARDVSASVNPDADG